MASSLNLTQSPFYSGFTFTTANTVSTNVTILGSNPTTDRRIYGIGVTSSDNANNNMLFSINDGTTSFPLCRFAVSLSAGTNTSTAVFDVLGSSLMVGITKERDSNGASFFHLPKGCSLQAQYQTAMAVNEYLTVHIQGHTY